MKRLFSIIIVAISVLSCGEDKEIPKEIPQEKQLNISILIDMSDRINSQFNPDVEKNDIENIRTITELFKSNMEKLGVYKAKGKIRLFFSPSPANANINSIVSRLIIDCSKMDNIDKKKVHDSLSEIYSNNIKQIFEETIKTSNWDGSDIWRFFKDDVELCMDKDLNYRNILIILTDGYLYHKQSYFNKNNRFTYLLSKNLNDYRKQNVWKQMIDQNDFGIISERNDLNDLEVLVVGIQAENPDNKIDEDILRHLWEKWFNEMNISHFKVYPANLPANLKPRIESFLENK